MSASSGSVVAGLIPASSATAGGLDFQHVVDFAADVGEPALGALEALLGARQLLARGAGRFERGAGVAVGLGQRVLGFLQAIGAGARGRLPRSATSPISALRFSAKTCGAFSSSARSRLASAMRCSSVAIWVRAPSRRSFQPALSAGERREPPVGQFRLAHDRLLLGAHLGELGALAGDVVAHGGELGFEIGGGRQRGQRALGLGLGGARLVAAGGKARARFGERREPRRPGG